MLPGQQESECEVTDLSAFSGLEMNSCFATDKLCDFEQVNSTL